MKNLLLLLFITASCIISAQVENGLIAKYSFNSQNTLDESGNANDGIAFNLTSTADRFGNTDKAYDFNGEDSYMALPSALLLTQNISISFWFKTDSTKGCLLGHQNRAVDTLNPNQFVPIAYMKSDTTLNATLWSNSPDNTNTSVSQYNDGEWHHLVIAGDISSQKIYIDGVNEGTGAGYALLNSLTFGQFGTGYVSGTWANPNPQGWSYFDGSIDDIRIYERVIDSLEVNTLFKIEDPTVGISNLSFEAFNIYPNPTNDFVKLEIEETLNSIQILDLTGKTVQVFNPETKQLNISELNIGIYFLEIANAEKKSVIKIIKK